MLYILYTYNKLYIYPHTYTYIEKLKIECLQGES